MFRHLDYRAVSASPIMNMVHKDINKVIPPGDFKGAHLSWNAIVIIRSSLLSAVHKFNTPCNELYITLE